MIFNTHEKEDVNKKRSFNTGGTVTCHYDNFWCKQWRQSCQIDDLFSVYISNTIITIYIYFQIQYVWNEIFITILYYMLNPAMQ